MSVLKSLYVYLSFGILRIWVPFHEGQTLPGPYHGKLQTLSEVLKKYILLYMNSGRSNIPSVHTHGVS